MNKMNNLKEILIISGIAGFLSDLFASIQTAYAILIFLSLVDTTTGIIGAVRQRRFSSRGLAKLVKKVMVYTLCIITVRLLEIGIAEIIEINVLSQIMVSFLILIEAISVLENLALLGAPIPTKLITYLIEQLNIPGLEDLLKYSRSEDKDLQEIEEIIRYQIPTFKNSNVRQLLEIKFKVWKNVLTQLNILLGEHAANDNELLYYKVMTVIEGASKEIHDLWERAHIPKDLIERFNKSHQPKVNTWLKKVKAICYSQDTIFVKKETLNESIIVILYQTILDAHKE